MRNYATKVYDYIEPKTGRHVVKAVTLYAGKTVCAYAKCDPVDEFDLNFGVAVATRRLDAKIAKKRAATAKHRALTCQRAIDFLKQELKRMTKAKDQAEVLAGNCLAEAEQYNREVEDLLTPGV